MRATLACLMVSILTVLAFSMAPTAQASQAQVVYWQGAHASGLNAVSPEGTITDFIVTMRVPKGERIVAFGDFVLNMRNGNDKFAEGHRLNRRTVEYHVFAGRRAKVDLANPTDSYAYPVELSNGAVAKIRIKRLYISTTP